MNFMDALENTTNMTTTTNGESAKLSTNNYLVDLFADGSALRNRRRADVETKISRALSTDILLGTKLLFYIRDIRGVGTGERETFRVGLKMLAKTNPQVVNKNIENIPFYGRFDDLFVLFGTESEDAMLAYIKKQWEEDIKNLSNEMPISLMAKWLPSANASSEATRDLAYKVRKHLGMKEKYYRKALSSMRAYLDVVEKKMSSNDWLNIDYKKVPSYAMNRYRTAFYKHDLDGMTKFIDKVTSGETTINASTLYPYDIVEKIFNKRDYYSIDKVLEAQWKALPNYVEGENNMLVMADVSGSMSGRPMATSIGLAIYFAERNKGAFANKFMTFSESPEIQTVIGATLNEKVMNLSRAKWDMNTNLEKAFDKILTTAVENNVPQEQLPKSLIIITDMQFDSCVHVYSARSTDTFYDKMSKKFALNGYELPNVVFWNVNSPKDTYQVSSDVRGVQLVSGQSASTFKVVLGGVGKTPYELMLETLNDEYFDRIVV